MQTPKLPPAVHSPRVRVQHGKWTPTLSLILSAPLSLPLAPSPYREPPLLNVVPAKQLAHVPLKPDAPQVGQLDSVHPISIQFPLVLTNKPRTKKVERLSLKLGSRPGFERYVSRARLLGACTKWEGALNLPGILLGFFEIVKVSNCCSCWFEMLGLGEWLVFCSKIARSL
jgi:hypothetical protein